MSVPLSWRRWSAHDGFAHASAVVRNEKDEPIQKIPSDAAWSVRDFP